MWYRGYGENEPETVIVVGFEYSYLGSFFHSCKTVGRVTNRYGVKNEESTYHTGLYVCRNPVQPWNRMWKQMQWFQ
jgi:hypothetical protein